ncbi:uncharacterized protein LOC111400620 [Olea europaea var. sylvestris]|uniref:uncharacterized protein LOC111400620 n=1 Tax=Olea europaea var. sylvestris TaxID=158386 RepID=UPI000C1D0FEB|nr:uncharacterized protein LOC111400620 [Olea europaea var. sylvestris]
MRKCSNHGITLGNQVLYFYTGLTPLSKSQVDASSGGLIIGKSGQQTMDLFELISTIHLMFSSERVVPPKAAGISTCENCGRNHATESCISPEEQVNFIQNSSCNFNSCGNNFQQERRPSLGEMFQQYLQKVDKMFQQIDTNFQNQQASIKKLETQIGQIAQQLAERPQGTLPSNTMINPKEQVMTIKIVDNDLLRVPVKVTAYVPPLSFPQRLRKKLMEKNIHVINTKSEVQSPEITTERPKRKDDQEVIDEATRLKKNKQDTNYEKFLNVLKKLQINVPFIDVILQISSYTKFLKEMLTKKRKLPKFETVTLTEESSARV